MPDREKDKPYRPPSIGQKVTSFYESARRLEKLSYGEPTKSRDSKGSGDAPSAQASKGT